MNKIQFVVISLSILITCIILTSGCISHQNQPICGSQYYNNSTQSCCNGVVLNGPMWEACNNACYDSSIDSCCNGIIYNGTTWKLCCKNCYNSSFASCIDGTISIKPEFIERVPLDTSNIRTILPRGNETVCYKTYCCNRSDEGYLRCDLTCSELKEFCNYGIH
jgi:hypothetical protein